MWRRGTLQHRLIDLSALTVRSPAHRARSLSAAVPAFAWWALLIVGVALWAGWFAAIRIRRSRRLSTTTHRPSEAPGNGESIPN